MSERKPWTQKEDQILKQLKQVRKIGKWSQISMIMKSQFQIFGRNGKQCRERYHNHLDSRISKQKWERDQQKMLLELHNQWGNRWAAISRELPGRTDNCVKNHFYSYFRKCIKNVNVLIANHCRKRIRPIKLGVINKIVPILEGYHKNATEFDKTLYQQTRNIKNDILDFGEEASVSVEKCIAKLEELSQSMTKFNQASRSKLMKRKKVKVQSEDSEVDFNNIDQNDEQIQKSGTNKKDEVKVKREQVDEQVKLEAQSQKQNINFVKEQEQNHGVKTNQVLAEQTPQKQKRDEKEKSSSCLIINSVDYLDAKNQHAHDIKDFIFIDDDKQWKLYFQ